MEMHEDNEEKSLDRPSPRELEVLGLPADATDAPLSVEQLEKLARHYAAWLYTLGFTYAAYGLRVPEILSALIPEILSGLRSEVRSNGQEGSGGTAIFAG